jgi:hypothetical protein
MPDLKSLRHFLQPRSLKRVFAFLLALLFLTEIALPPLMKEYYTRRAERYLFDGRLPRNFEQIHRDLPSAINYISQNEDHYDINVLFLGDSVAYGAGVGEGESIPAYLEQELSACFPGKQVRVWNLAIPGSEPGDLYCLLHRLEGLEPDAVVADFNMIFYGKASVEDPLAFHWLYLDPGISPEAVKTVDSIYPRSGKERIGEFFVRHWNLYGKREILNAILFGGHPRQRLENVVWGVWVGLQGRDGAASQQSATKIDPQEQREKVAFMYSPAPVDPATNEAYLFTKEILTDLDRSGRKTLVFMTDQNSEILGDLITCAPYQHNVRVVDDLLRSSAVPYISFYGKLPSWMFVDHVHLNPGGNKHVAGVLAEQLAPLLRGEQK